MRRLLTAALTTSLATALAVVSAPAATAATRTVDRGPSSSLTGAHVVGVRDLAVAGGRTYLLTADTVKVFAAGASGAAAPQRTIDVDPDPGQEGRAIAVGRDGTIFVLTTTPDLGESWIGRFDTSATGSTWADNVAFGLDSPLDLAERPDGSIAVLDNDSNTIAFFGFPQFGQPQPRGRIEAGSNTRTRIFGPSAIDTAPDGRLVVTGTDWVSVFAANATGDVAPQQYLQGARTRIGIPLGAGLDARGNLYVGSADSWESGRNSRVLRFDRGATGDVSPATVLAGARSGLSRPYVETLPAGGFVRANFDAASGIFAGPVSSYRALGPYVAPAAPTGLKATGKARAAKRALTWRPAVADADVPVTSYAVQVTCKPTGKKTKVVLTRTLPASTRKVVVTLGKVRKGSCTATLSARNAVGTSAIARTRFTVRR